MAHHKPNIDFEHLATQSASKLMSLPPELRNRIFEIVSLETTINYAWSWRGASRPYSRHRLTIAPGHVLACKQLYLESIDVLYANASFDLSKTSWY